MSEGGIVKAVVSKIGRLLGYEVTESWTASDGTYYHATSNKRGKFAGYRRDPPKRRMSKKARIALRGAAKEAA